MRSSIATVCLSGTLQQKLHACAAADFDGVEIFEPDLVAAPQSPEEIRALSERLGLSLDLYQPMRDVEGVSEDRFADVLRRAEAKFAVMQRLGMDLVLCCSNAGNATIDDDATSAAQLRRLGDLAQRHGIKIAYEALAWGRFVNDYRRAWHIVELADHPAVGTCLDSFHILSSGHDPAHIGDIPGERIFFVQLADAPELTLDVLSWSRHHRLFPGEGSFDLTGFLAEVLRAGYRGPLSLEVFNDTFRQVDVGRTAVHARRSLRWLEDSASAHHPEGREVVTLTRAAGPTGFDFVEITAEDTLEVEVILGQLGFTFRGRHRTKPVTLWSAGAARVVLNEQYARDVIPHVAGIGLHVPDHQASAARARELGAPLAHRRTHAREQALPSVIAPDGTRFYWTDHDASAEPPWVGEFGNGYQPHPAPDVALDHVNLAQPWQVAEESLLFHTAVLGLVADEPTEVASPRGLVRSQVMRNAAGTVRLPRNVAPPILAQHGREDGSAEQHIAFRCADITALARAARAAGLRFVAVPQNYYDDLGARFGLPAPLLAELSELDLLYDRDEHGEFLHCYSQTVGQLFLEFVERRGGYDGYGAGNAPIRLAAQVQLPG